MQVLVALWLEGGQSVGQLAARLELRPTTVSNGLRRLHADSLVRAEADSEDHRRHRQTLTKKGARLADRFIEQSRARMAGEAADLESPRSLNNP